MFATVSSVAPVPVYAAASGRYSRLSFSIVVSPITFCPVTVSVAADAEAPVQTAHAAQAVHFRIVFIFYPSLLKSVERIAPHAEELGRGVRVARHAQLDDRPLRRRARDGA